MCEYSKAKGLSKKKEILVFFSKSLFFMKSELWLLNFSPCEQFPFLLNKALIRVHSVLARQWLNVYRRLRSYVRRTISLLVYLSYLYVYLLDCVWWIDFFFNFVLVSQWTWFNRLIWFIFTGWILFGRIFWGKMSEVFEGYERQYCELSVNLSRKCNSAALLADGGNWFTWFFFWKTII